MTKQAFQSFAKQGPDGIVVVNGDDLFADDHPFVKAWPEHFGEHMDMATVTPAPAKVTARAKVEKATAEPGETRDVDKPKTRKFGTVTDQ